MHLQHSKNIKIGFFGEAMLEISGEPLQKKYGGDVLNTAIYLSRLCHKQNNPEGPDFDIHFITAMGADSISQSLINEWQCEGIKTDLISIIDDKKPGLYIIENLPDGERIFHYWRSDSAARYYFKEWPSPLAAVLLNRGIDYFYLSGTSLAILSPVDRARLLTLLSEFKQAGGQIIFDSNYRPSLWQHHDAQDCYREVLALTHIAFLTDTDEEMVFGSSEPEAIIERHSNLGINEIVIKYGAAPCVVYAQTNTAYVAHNQVEHVVDTCAAGDSFAAAYLLSRFSGGSYTQAAQAGHDLAATVIQYGGALVPIDVL